MGRIITAQHKKLYKQMVEQIRKDIGRKVQIFYPGARVHCGNCIWDAVNKRSAGIYSPASPYPSGQPGPTPFTKGQCPTCLGVGQYTQTLSKEIICNIRWAAWSKRSSVKETSELGMNFDFDCRLQTDIKYENYFLRPQINVIVDGQSFEPIKVYPRGLGELIQIYVYLRASELNVPGNTTRTTFGVPQ